MRFLVITVLMLLLTGCTESIRQWEKEQVQKMQSKTDFELCELVSTNAWPPTAFRGNAWARRELESRSVPHFLCHKASKACVSFGYEFNSEAHRECTLEEGRNMALVAAAASAKKASKEKAKSRSENPSFNTKIPTCRTYFYQGGSRRVCD